VLALIPIALQVCVEPFAAVKKKYVAKAFRLARFIFGTFCKPFCSRSLSACVGPYLAVARNNLQLACVMKKCIMAFHSSLLLLLLLTPLSFFIMMHFVACNYDSPCSFFFILFDACFLASHTFAFPSIIWIDFIHVTHDTKHQTLARQKEMAENVDS
jgi:hypothetical protein